jgi:two-component system nitrogen regulation response regulator GlnG
MQRIFRLVSKVAKTDSTVLLNGESGTGKELIARSLHLQSRRSQGPFVPVNVGAIPEALIESELFGYVRGAFTGAAGERVGLVEEADRGTLFLDEIGDMPPDLQTRLLRVLSDGQFYRVGGHQPIKSNVRIIAATHQDLENRVKSGLFREDLFHRLNVIRLRLPALRERRDDIPLLARHFLQKSARELGVDSKKLSEAAMKYLTSLDLPGNVRQLENLCHWLTVMAPGMNIDVKDLPPELREETRDPSAGNWVTALEREAEASLKRGDSAILDELTRQFERALITRALAHTGGRRIEASVLLGMGRNTLTRKIQELGLGEETSREK